MDDEAFLGFGDAVKRFSLVCGFGEVGVEESGTLPGFQVDSEGEFDEVSQSIFPDEGLFRECFEVCVRGDGNGFGSHGCECFCGGCFHGCVEEYPDMVAFVAAFFEYAM